MSVSYLRRAWRWLFPPATVLQTQRPGVVSVPTDGPPPDLAQLFPARRTGTSGWVRPVVRPPRDEDRLPGVPEHEDGPPPLDDERHDLFEVMQGAIVPRCVCGWRGRATHDEDDAHAQGQAHLDAHHHVYDSND